jgi:hypothetical protein
MPFCRKCGRRLVEYSESCPDCGTSTTATLIKIKKAAPTRLFRADAPTKVAKAILPSKATPTIKGITPSKPAKTGMPATTIPKPKPKPPEVILSNKPVEPAPVYPPHEIKQSNVSIEEDIIANPQDYETQTFTFDLKCSYGHFWREGRALPVSKGKAYCPKCGDRLRKPKKKKRQQYFRV